MDSNKSTRQITAYMVALAAVCLALLIKVAVDSFGFASLSPFRFFFLPVVIAAWYGGIRPGLVALSLGALVNSILFLAPTPSILVTAQDELVQLVMFLIEGGIICVLAGALHASKQLSQANQRRAEAATRRIESQANALEKAQNQILEAMQSAEAGIRAKTEFLANISHELRTPMNAIIGMTELTLHDEQLPAPARENLEIAYESAENLMHMVNDVLDFSKMEAGKFELSPQPFALRDVLADTFKSLAHLAHEKDLEFGCHIQTNVPEYLQGDATRLRQVITNLVNNAIKFTSAGDVHATISVKSIKKNIATLQFRVADTGVGIAEKDRDAIFSAFTQADNSTTRKYHGSGLGLSIVTELVKAMGGRIWLESEVGQGSKFFFTARFPVLKEHQVTNATPSVNMAACRGMKVLVVDDSETNRTILAETLSGWGMETTLVGSGQAALDELAKSRDLEFALIILDAQMPQMDGFELAKRIQAEPELAQAPILMLSSLDRSQFARRSTELGISAYLEKPVLQWDLARALMQAIGHPVPEEVTDECTTQQLLASKTDHPLKILVAEDTPANQKVVERILQRRGHRVVIAQNGKEAADFANATEFDVVLMDIQMPVMDGLQATKAIRSYGTNGNCQTLPSVPIIAMTAHAMRGDRARCLAAGMDGYLSKPIDAEAMILKVETLASPSEFDPLTDDLQATPLAKPETSPPGVASMNQGDKDSIIDLKAARKRLGNDDELLLETIGFFLEDVDPLLNNLRQAVSAGEHSEAQRAAHSLKSLASTFGAEAAASTALRAEQAAEAESVEEVAAELPAINDAFEQLTTHLRALKTRLKQNRD